MNQIILQGSAHRIRVALDRIARPGQLGLITSAKLDRIRIVALGARCDKALSSGRRL